METEILIRKLEAKLNKYYFIKTKQTDCDTQIIALSKSTNDVRMSFSYDENSEIIYRINCVSISFDDLYKFVILINELFEE